MARASAWRGQASSLAQVAFGGGCRKPRGHRCGTDRSLWGDAPVLSDFLDQLDPEEPIVAVAADGRYATQAGQAAILQRGALVLIPPRVVAVAWPDQADGLARPRTALLCQGQAHGHARWQPAGGYPRRNLAEPAMFWIKTRFGDKLNHRRFATQATEAHARIAALNLRTRLGRPDSYPARC